VADAVTLRLKGPYDLPLSVRAAEIFSPQPAEDMSFFRSAVRIDGAPAIVEVRQIVKNPLLLEVTGVYPGGIERLRLRSVRRGIWGSQFLFRELMRR
jgi:hypothetical protein